MTLSTEQTPAVDQTEHSAAEGSRKGPFSLAVSFAIGFAIWVTSLFVDLVLGFAVVFFEFSRNPGMDPSIFIRHPASQGLVMTLSTCITMPLSVALVLAIVKLRRGPSVMDYLAVRDVSLADVFKWVGITLILGLLCTAVSVVTERPVPQFITAVFEGAVFYPELWIGLVVAAPVYEEIFFRGFLFEGISWSRLGPVGAVVLTSLVWTAVHLQYDYFELGMLLIFGIVIGAARLKTRSIVPCIAMHFFFNFMAAVEAVLTLAVLTKC